MKKASYVRNKAPEEGRRAHRPKHCEYKNKDEDNSPNNWINANKKNELKCEYPTRMNKTKTSSA